jgi:CheY-like chemotaxis protein
MTTVLIAEDDPLLRRTLAVVLRARGMRVLEAANGEEAINLAMHRHPDIALMDLVMPKVDGLEAIKLLRAQCPDLKIVALSGGGRNRYLDILTLADRLGAHACLAKPFTPKQLIELLETKFALGPAAPAHDGGDRKTP